MYVLGVDPGVARTGYGVVVAQGDRWGAVSYGSIVSEAREPLSRRLRTIYDELTAVLDASPVDGMAVEELFLAKNPRMALSVGHARGVVLLLAEQRGIPVFEYAVTEIKRAVVGNGAASKEQVRYMVSKLLGLGHVPQAYDAADALAVALCHLQRTARNPMRTSG
ncbi:MAG: crossover junction endodeoxyribonuclease RuvC [candidate division KSB1 bacterium]|nr:crossover junction endodeoxyribonuclease RuvC [candidate division KSB1 bacterium]MDZ7392479.1 crossover junction endodeoxyribonuclease RuvC [candidate division KSB1 bacterium]MDZ7412232.1 crossover junction endodeoxyribonuclease RuvC [candidate division KSB1 bacterium]